MSQEKIKIGIILGSDSDWPQVETAVKLLKTWGVGHEVTVASAHRSPERVHDYVRKAEARGLKVLIAVAGAAAHLAGVVASQTILPVIGVPIASSALHGLDSLLATSQMPAGVPVATMALGSAGARNAVILGMQILALGDPGLRQILVDYKADLARKVEEADEKLKEELAGGAAS